MRGRCSLCDFRKSAIVRKKQLNFYSSCKLSGACFVKAKDSGHEERHELTNMTGDLLLEKSSFPPVYYEIVTLTGVCPRDAGSEVTVCTTMKIPTRVCPGCGRQLMK